LGTLSWPVRDEQKQAERGKVARGAPMGIGDAALPRRDAGHTKKPESVLTMGT